MAAISALLLAALPVVQGAGAPVPSGAVAAETSAQRDARMAWFREARFGIFLHWGLYSVAGGSWDGKRVDDCGEWIQHFGNIPTSRYAELLPRFAPTKYDPERWARLFKASGARYVVATTKHHDGFCLWDSAVNDDWDAKASGAGRDLIAPLAQALRAQGLKFGAYYSILDWRHPDYGARPRFNDHAKGEPDMRRYVEGCMLPQLAELAASCKPDYLWFDGGWDACYTHEMGMQVDDRVRALIPGVVVNNRVDKGFTGMDGRTAPGFRGDCGTPEQEIPENGFGPGVDWETCYSMMKIPGKWTWGWRTDVTEWSTARQIVDLLVECSSKGGNLLLNVGPTPEGEIPAQAVEPLEATGAWLGRHATAIHGTQASPFPRKLEFGHATRRGARLYLFVADAKPGQMLRLPRLSNEILAAELLGSASGSALAFGRRGKDALVFLPADLRPDPLRTVVEVLMDGEPRVESRLAPEGGRLLLLPEDAALHGRDLRVERRGGSANIGYWLDPGAWASWEVELPTGEWTISARLGCKRGSEGSTIELLLGEALLAEHAVQATGDDWDGGATVSLGSWRAEGPVSGALRLRARDKRGEAVANVWSVELVQAGSGAAVK